MESRTHVMRIKKKKTKQKSPNNNHQKEKKERKGKKDAWVIEVKISKKDGRRKKDDLMV